ncbi:hypothetical protein NBRC116493_17780 [Aurantivibrio infirmus]
MTCGVLITFSGVDGAGKTTLLREVKRELELRLDSPLIELRQRPSILPILSSFKHGKKAAEENAANNKPRMGLNNSIITSFFRFLYYFSDYFFGQWVVYFKYQRKGYNVLYDRYYYDFIADPKRANLRLSRGFALFMFKFVFTPKINFFLYANPKTILSRKMELSEYEILELTENYGGLFQELSDKNSEKFISINNEKKSKSLDRILATIIENL